MNKISFLFAKNCILILTLLILIFHLLIILKVIPYSIVWAGKLTNDTEMFRFESISIIVNAIYLLLILGLNQYASESKVNNFIRILLWGFVILFALNTIGNLFAESKIEMLIFTPYTFILALFTARILREKIT